jgi:hypothetical protein
LRSFGYGLVAKPRIFTPRPAERAPTGRGLALLLEKALRGACNWGALSPRLSVIRRREKGKMKKLNSAIVGLFVLLVSSVSSFAVEGLQLSVQSSNVVLSWPTVDGSGATYIVRYRHTLNPTDSWQTLTSSLPAATGTNITVFVHSNIVQYPPVPPDGGGGGNIMPDGMSGASAAPSSTAPDMLMAVPANGSGSAAPLMIYPSGFDLSGFTIFDPATGESVSGRGYLVKAASMNTMQAGGVQPMDAGSGDTNQYTGFYQVAQDGVHIFGLTNGTVLNGEVQMPIEIAVDSTDQISGVNFYNSSDDSPVIGAHAVQNGGWTFDWDTSMVENGSYSIYAEVDFVTDDSVSSTNIPVSLTVSNIISFPNYFTRVFGSQMWIYAETIPNASYQLDIYDEDTNYLGSFYDYADSSGYISFIWDLTDGNGHTFDSTNFYGVFTVDTSSLSSLAKPLNASPSGFLSSSPAKKTFGGRIKTNGIRPADSGSSASAKQTWALEAPWANNDKFAVAFAPLNEDPTTTFKMSEMMIGGDGGEDGGVVSSLSEYGLAYQLSPGNVAQSSAFEMATATDKTNLLSYLADGSYRNFYFCGHGNQSVINGYDNADPADARAVLISAATVQKMLGNFLNTGKPQNFHPYRFVMLDCCDAGKGKSWTEAFGIPAKTVNNQFFINAGVRSRAFLGFTKSPSFNTAQWEYRSQMLGTFFGEWMQGATVQQSVNAARQQIFQPMDPSWVIYGATNLTRSSQ